jgi:GNAT superfamily N-acetyltransferase
MTSFVLVPADTLDAARLHAAFTAAFSDYLIGAFRLSLQHWPALLARQCVDLSLSRAALHGGEIAAFAFVAPRASLRPLWRLATMGAPPAHRGHGAAQVLLDDFIARAAQVGCHTELECFEQNERALKLYRSRGFEAISPLYGYTFTSPPGDPQPVSGEVAREDAFAWIAEVAQQRGDLPLQVTPPSLQGLPAALRAARSGNAQVLWSMNDAGGVTIHSLIDTDAAQEDAQSLVMRLLRAHPAQKISVPQLQRPDIGGRALERCGFERLAMNQLLMRRAA